MVRQIVNGRWSFGQSKANYIDGDEQIAQSVATRLKSFKFDWFLDYEANIDWLRILGTKNNEAVILSEVRRITTETAGVARINDLQIEVKDRNATINLSIKTVSGADLPLELSV